MYYQSFAENINPGYLERTSVLDFVEAAPTGIFFSYLSLPDKRIIDFTA